MLSPHSQVAEAKWGLHSVEIAGASGLPVAPQSYVLPPWPLWTSNMQPRPQAWSLVWDIGANPLDVGQQAKAAAETLLTSGGSKNLVISMGKAIKLQGRLTGLENQDMSLGVADGCRAVWMTVDRSPPQEKMVSSGTHRSWSLTGYALEISFYKLGFCRTTG